MRTTVRYRILLLAMSAALLVSACGTSGGKDTAKKPKKPTSTEVAEPSTTEPDTTGTSDTTEPDTTESTEPGSSTPSGDAKSRAEAANITADDFPPGWSSSPVTPSAADQTYSTCAPELKIEDATVAKASSDRFKKGAGSQSAQVSSVSRVLDSEDTARQVMKTFAQADFVKCVDTQLKKATSISTTLSGSLEPSSGDQSYGDESTVITGAFTAKSSSGKSSNLEIDLVAIRTADVVTILTTLVVDKTAYATLFDDLASKIADRQQN